MTTAERRKHRIKYTGKGLLENQEAMLWDLKETKDELLPTIAELLRKVTPEVLGDRVDDLDWIKENLSEVISRFEDVAYGRYMEAELHAAGTAMIRAFSGSISDEASRTDILEAVCRDHYATLNEFFLSLSQGRKARAGKTFEYVVAVLFDLLDLPYTAQAVINGKPDFLMPGKAHYENHAMDCIIFTLKRTLRERWRQITTEGTKGSIFFLGTLDADKTASDIAEMLRNRIYLVVPTQIKKAKEHYQNAVNVISFEVFFRDHIDPAMQRWQDNGVI